MGCCRWRVGDEIACLILILPVAGQDGIRTDSVDIALWVKDADSIVVGTIRAGMPFPWFDGWHYRSHINVQEHLAPPGSREPIAFSWVLPFGGSSCLLCDDLRPLDGQTGIWFLRQRDGTLKVFGGTKGWCSAPLETRYIGAVRNAIQQEWHTGGTR